MEKKDWTIARTPSMLLAALHPSSPWCSEVFLTDWKKKGHSVHGWQPSTHHKFFLFLELTYHEIKVH